MSASTLFAEGPFVTDGGLETDLIFHQGIDLPEFASFPLLEDRAGRAALDAYYDQYAAIARAAVAGLLVETPTWRANPDWGRRVGYGREALERVNREAVAFARGVQERAEVARSLVVGILGPRGDGYVPGARTDPDEAADYHAAQARSFAAEGVDLVHAMTLTTPEEAIGVVRAARSCGLPVVVSFTVETDGRLPDGTPLAEAVERLDTLAPPDWFGVNCAHPTHVAPAFDGGALGGADRGAPAERVDPHARRARRDGAAGRGRPRSAHVVCRAAAVPPARARRGRWVLRHRRAPRRGALGRLSVVGPEGQRQRTLPSSARPRRSPGWKTSTPTFSLCMSCVLSSVWSSPTRWPSSWRMIA